MRLRVHLVWSPGLRASRWTVQEWRAGTWLDVWPDGHPSFASAIAHARRYRRLRAKRTEGSHDA